MPTFYGKIPEHLRDWALSQPVFFTASAPLTGAHINISPKGLPAATFSIFSPNECAYIDATGSGSETISHIYENGRVTIMFCSFATSPRILRFFCKGRVVEYDRPEYGRLLQKMGKKEVLGARAVIVLDVWKVQVSCGYGVPLLQSYKESDAEDGAVAERATMSPWLDRETLGHWAKTVCDKNQISQYQIKWNSNSLDGLPGLQAARRDSKEWLWVENMKAWIRRVAAQKEGIVLGLILGIAVMLLAQLVGLPERIVLV